MGLFSRLQSFSYVQARRFARHPDRSYRSAKAPGSRGFYVHAYLGLLPPRAVDMLSICRKITFPILRPIRLYVLGNMV